MDGAPTPKAGSGRRAVLPAVPAGIDAGAATSCARVARKATLPAAAAGAAEADAPAAATAAPGAENSGGRGEEEDDDEQVERFYALLDNIRAMRGAYVSGSGDGDGTGADDGVVDTGGGAGARVKRLRGSEPPWRPAFRLEDFEFVEPTPTSLSSDVAPCAKRSRGQEADGDGEGSGGARTAVAAATAVRVRLHSGRKSV